MKEGDIRIRMSSSKPFPRLGSSEVFDRVRSVMLSTNNFRQARTHWVILVPEGYSRDMVAA